MGRDALRRERLPELGEVSTHAPLWGATPLGAPGRGAPLVSTHAPLWGATRAGRRPSARAARFNPRAPMGRDTRHALHSRLSPFVSTHAPLWGATRPVVLGGVYDVVSTHAPLWGATRHDHHPGVAGDDVSTHAPLWGATTRPSASTTRRRSFNPRAPMGRDWQFMQDSAFFTYSIHFSRCVAPCATSKLSLWACHSARTS